MRMVLERTRGSDVTRTTSQIGENTNAWYYPTRAPNRWHESWSSASQEAGSTENDVHCLKVLQFQLLKIFFLIIKSMEMNKRNKHWIKCCSPSFIPHVEIRCY